MVKIYISQRQLLLPQLFKIFLQDAYSQTLSPQTFRVDKSRHCNLRHSLESQDGCPDSQLPRRPCVLLWIWLVLSVWRSCFWLKQIIKALLFSRLWFPMDFVGENSKNSIAQHTQFGSSLCSPFCHSASNMIHGIASITLLLHKVLGFALWCTGVFSDLSSALTAGYHILITANICSNEMGGSMGIYVFQAFIKTWK